MDAPLTSRLTRLASALADAGLDALFVTNPKNVEYLTGFQAMMPGSVQPFGDPEGFVVARPDRLDFLCDGRYVEGARAIPGVHVHRVASPTTPTVLANAFAEILGDRRSVVGFESDALLYGDAVGLFEATAAYDWRPAESVLRKQREVKTEDEVAKIHRAQAITCDCFEHIAGWIRIGMTEREVALEIERYLKRHSEGLSFDSIVAFGETCSHPHYVPDGSRKLEAGQMVLLDFGAVHDGYCGDLTRMLSVGEPSQRLREVYDLVLEANERCIAAVKPGETGHDLDAVCRDFFAAHDVDDAFLHGTGHGLGLAIHEAPSLKQSREEPVSQGMVFTVEPGLYIDGWGGVRLEDVVEVTADGARNLTKADKVLRVVSGI